MENLSRQTQWDNGNDSKTYCSKHKGAFQRSKKCVILQLFPLVCWSKAAARDTESSVAVGPALRLSQSCLLAALDHSGLDNDNKYSFTDALRYHRCCHWRRERDNDRPLILTAAELQFHTLMTNTAFSCLLFVLCNQQSSAVT